MAYETLPGAITNGDNSTQRFYAVRLTGSTAVDFEIGVCTSAIFRPIGILQDNPNTSGSPAEVAISGVAKAQFAGTVAQGDPLGTDAAGRLITLIENAAAGSSFTYVIAYSLQNGTSGGNYTVLLCSPHTASSGA